MELDLNNPAVVEKLLNADVVGGFPKMETQQIEEKIKAKQKLASFTMKLAQSDIDALKRQAGSKNLDWKQHLKNEIEAKILTAKIGGPTIATPSTGLEPTKKIGGPSPNSKILRIG
ncbi:hypothetical protein SynBIOSE41_01788 [Synechococcus sp. BIOS-E4-1]|nr:hypothetical protein SynBIOSE41_01788 [Synechococcus sp. BIOS-E4-1]